jgi:hypothetical protein
MDTTDISHSHLNDHGRNVNVSNVPETVFVHLLRQAAVARTHVQNLVSWQEVLLTVHLNSLVVLVPLKRLEEGEEGVVVSEGENDATILIQLSPPSLPYTSGPSRQASNSAP